MGVVDGFKGLVGIGGSNQPDYPQPPPSYPEMGGMYQAWEQQDLQGIVGVTLDNSSLLISLEQNLRGNTLVTERDEKTGRVAAIWKQTGEQKMNEFGIQSVIMEVRGFIDKNTIMGYLPNEEELNKIWRDHTLGMILFLAENKKKFAIIPGYRSMLITHIRDITRMTMYRSLMGNEKEGVYKQLKRVENSYVPINDPRNTVGNAPQLFKT
jgi:hypothetical protein